VPISYEAERDPVPLLTFWGRDKVFYPSWESTPDSSVVQPAAQLQYRLSCPVSLTELKSAHVSFLTPTCQGHHQPHVTPVTPTSQLPTNSSSRAEQQRVREADKVLLRFEQRRVVMNHSRHETSLNCKRLRLSTFVTLN